VYDTPALSLSEVPVPSTAGGAERSVSLAVRSGTIGCLVEHDIAGLTCLSYLAGLRHPERGEVSVGGHRPHPEAGRAMLVRGGTRLCEGFTVGEHLALVGRHRDREVLRDFGLTALEDADLLECPVDELQLPLRQELEIGLAVLRGAGNLLLHRPFEGLLGAGRRRLLGLLRTFVGKGGACLYTTRYRTLARFAETVFLGVFGSVDGVEPTEGPEANAALTSFDAPADPAPGRVVGLFTRSTVGAAEVLRVFRERTRVCGRGGAALFHPVPPWYGLSPELTLAQSASYTLGDAGLVAWGHVRHAAAEDTVNEVLESLEIPGLTPATRPADVPSAWRARLALGLQLARVPHTLYAFRPCGGLGGDLPQAERRAVMATMREFAATGGSVVVATDDLEVLAGCSHEVRCVRGDVEGRTVLARGVFRRLLT